jgi:hypothetical protein
MPKKIAGFARRRYQTPTFDLQRLTRRRGRLASLILALTSVILAEELLHHDLSGSVKNASHLPRLCTQKLQTVSATQSMGRESALQ